MVVQFIDDHRDRFGVEPICRVLTEHAVPIAPSGYYAFKKRPVSARAVKDAELVIEIERVFWDRKLGRGVSGARKIWRLLKREGIVVARCTVERLLRQQGLRGIRRGKQFVTTRPDTSTPRAEDRSGITSCLGWNDEWLKLNDPNGSRTIWDLMKPPHQSAGGTRVFLSV